MTDFWSRRKAAVAAEAHAGEEALEAARRAEAEAALEARSDAELLEEAGLPQPEEITGGEMARKFLEAQLPRRLKNRALRALWRSNPVLACLDGLNDYDTDFTDAATCTPDLKTTYQVGKGMLAHLEHAGRAKEPPAPAAAVPPGDAAGPGMAEAEESPAPAAPDLAAEAVRDETDPEGPALPASSRRMRFRFEAS
ncbi:DUF3306 domain-containing protein [Mangrovicoccus sp. HB161399]|uniref:DUF3306 domain-containing protein n=1 Tax=Mangrovicoccus sp. HB161399 TaxID=2720392 RepID=UPI001558130D|nr:DUF3306 domain-containing protein [Mangrovicoccus sp. HB161399]